MSNFSELARVRQSNERFKTIATLVAFAGIALLTAIDIAMDLRSGTAIGHVAVELAIVAIGIVGALVMARRLAVALRDSAYWRASSAALQSRLLETTAEAQKWRDEARQLLQGLGSAIDAQLERWGLSRAEKEVALLLLKGLSHHEIAAARGISEATARQQARAVYRKADLDGRHDLAAFFLEDLLLPMEPPP